MLSIQRCIFLSITYLIPYRYIKLVFFQGHRGIKVGVGFRKGISSAMFVTNDVNLELAGEHLLVMAPHLYQLTFTMIN